MQAVGMALPTICTLAPVGRSSTGDLPCKAPHSRVAAIIGSCVLLVACTLTLCALQPPGLWQAGAGKLKTSSPGPRVLQDTTALSAAPQVYVYELPAEFNQLPLQRTPACRQHMSATEIVIHEALLNSSVYLTTSPEAADFFLVPVYAECHWVHVHQRLVHEHREREQLGQPFLPAAEVALAAQQELNGWFLSLTALLTQQHPHWNRTDGRDHIWTFPLGRSAWIFRDWKQHIEKSIFLTAGGYHDNLHQQGWEPFNTWKDIVIPLYQYHSAFWMGTDRYVSRRRKYLAAFRGDATNHHPRWSPEAGKMIHTRVRMVLKAAMNSDEDMIFIDSSNASVTPCHAECYRQLLYDSVFCMAPEGQHPNSNRPFEAMMVGCIPVIIADQYELPFESVLDWQEFSIKLPEADADNITQILHAIPPAVIERKREAMDAVWKAFTFPAPSEPGDAFHYIMDELARKRRRMKTSMNVFWN